MSELDREAQLEFILDHYQHPRNHGALSDADVHLEGGNPGCGDLVTVYLKIQNGRLEGFTFEGQGCTISQAAASITTEHAAHLTLEQVDELDHGFLVDELGEEAVSLRPRCATLALETLKAAVQAYRRRPSISQPDIINSPE